MCDFSQGFKLCTCHSQNERPNSNAPYWILSRRIPRKKDAFGDHIVGECSIDQLYGSDIREQILRALRSRNCFDQDFNIKPKDKLEIVTEDAVYSFEYRKNGWQVFHPCVTNGTYQGYVTGKVKPVLIGAC